MSYSSEILADSPLAWWSLGDAGSTMADSSGNSRTGTHTSVSSTTALAVGLPGTASSYGGSSVSVVTDASWMNTTVVSAEAWVKFPSNTGEHFVVGRDNNGADLRWRIDTSSNVFRWIVNVGGTLKVCQSGTMAANTLYHVAGTYDGTTLRLYVNGTELANLAASGTVVSTSGREIRLGLQSSGAAAFAGTMDDVAVFGTSLSAARILAHYNAGTTAPSNDATLSGTLQSKTAAFTLATVLATSLVGTLQPKTASFNVLGGASVSLAGTLQAKTAAFEMDVADAVVTATLAGSLQRKTAAFTVLGGASASLAGTLQAKTASFSLSAAAQATLAGTLQAKTADFQISIADRTVSLSGTMRRKTSAITLVSNPAVRLAANLRAKTAAFSLAAQPTMTFAATLQPKLSTFVTYVVTPVTASPVIGAQSVLVAQAFGPVTMQGTQPVYTRASAYIPRARQRIVVDGQDVTYFRGGITPNVSYTLLEPLLYGPATLDVPQVSACFETLGAGALSWLRPGAPVEVQRVLDDEVVGTDWKGVIVAFDTSGRNLSVELGGEASGRAALRNRQVPIFPRVNDIGRQFADSITDLGLPFYPHLGPVTGIEVMTTGGVGHLEHIQNLVAKAWTRAGKHWSIMPDESTGAYEAHRKDDTTIHGTVFIDDARTVANLRRDISEEPNRIFITGVLANGQRVRFGVYPGLIQGPVPAFMGHIEEGDTGEAVRLLVGKLHATGYLKLVEAEGGYDADVTDAVKRLQNDAGLFQTGEVNEATWQALYDLGVTGTSLEWAHIEPAAQRRKVRPWNRSAQGGIMGINEDYDPNHLVRDRNIDAGGGWKNRSQLSEFSWTVLHDSDDANWVGDITFNTGALIRGDGYEGMAVTAEDVMDARELRPGMNLSLPQFDDGTFVHIAAIQVDDEGIVTATVDTRFRDAAEVWEVIARNKESRNDPARTRNQKHRSSTINKDSIGEYDEFGGLLGQDLDLKPGWNEFQIVAAMEGTISRLRIVLETPAEFACMVFGGQVTADWLNNQIPRPLTNFGTKQIETTKRAELDDRGILYSAGTKDEPCGYWPGRKREIEYDEETDEVTSDSTNDPTGKHFDEAGFAYRSANRTELTVVVWVAEANKIPLQRITWNQLESGA